MLHAHSRQAKKRESIWPSHRLITAQQAKAELAVETAADWRCLRFCAMHFLLRFQSRHESPSVCDINSGNIPIAPNHAILKLAMRQAAILSSDVLAQLKSSAAMLKRGVCKPQQQARTFDSAKPQEACQLLQLLTGF